MGWLSVGVAIAGAIFAYLNGDFALAWGAGALALLAFWTYGVMHNYAVESAKRRRDYAGGFADFDAADLDAVPDWIALINMVTTIAAAVVTAVSAYRSW